MTILQFTNMINVTQYDRWESDDDISRCKILLGNHSSINTQVGNNATDWKQRRFRSNINAPLGAGIRTSDFYIEQKGYD